MSYLFGDVTFLVLLAPLVSLFKILWILLYPLINECHLVWHCLADIWILFISLILIAILSHKPAWSEFLAYSKLFWYCALKFIKFSQVYKFQRQVIFCFEKFEEQTIYIYKIIIFEMHLYMR